MLSNQFPRHFTILLLLTTFFVSPAFANKYLPIVPSQESTKSDATSKAKTTEEATNADDSATASAKSFNISVTQLPINKLIQLIGRETNANIILGDDFYTSDTADKQLPEVSLNYTGNNIEEVLTLFCQAYDYYWKHFADIGYVITKTRTATFKISRLADLNYEASFNAEKPQTHISGGTSLPYLTRIKQQVQSLLTATGQVSISASGFITVQDRPSNVRLVQQYLQAEEAQKELIQYNVKLIRAEAAAGISKHIDWSTGRVVHEWQSTGLLGSTIPFVAASSRFFSASPEDVNQLPKKVRNLDFSQVTVFLTPIKISDDTYQASVYLEVTENLKQPTAQHTENWATQHQNSTVSTVLLKKDATSLVTGLTFDTSRSHFQNSEVRVEYALLITPSTPTSPEHSHASQPVKFERSLSTSSVTLPCDKILYDDPNGVF